MLHWLNSITFGYNDPRLRLRRPLPLPLSLPLSAQAQHAHSKKWNEKKMISPKSGPTAKTTSVHVDPHDFEETKEAKPTWSAAAALSVELAKQTPWSSDEEEQHEDESVPGAQQIPRRKRSSLYLTRHSPPRLHLKKERPLSVQVHHLRHQHKATAAAVASTSVSVSGDLVTHTDSLLEPNDEASTTPPSIASTHDDRLSSPATLRLARQQQQELLKLEDNPHLTSSSASSVRTVPTATEKDHARPQHSPTAPAALPSSAQQDAMQTVMQNNHANSSAESVVLSSAASAADAGHSQASGNNPVLPLFQSEFGPPPAQPTVVQPQQPTTAPKPLLNVLEGWWDDLFSKKSSELVDPAAWRAQIRDSFARLLPDMKARPDQLVHKRIVVIGVHGWFPTKLVRSVIGEPTGTSKKFCHQMVAAVKHYFATEHQLTLPDSILTTIPLEGEGKVEERVAKHYHQLLANIAWLEAISSADVILWATHSQGTPVSFLLLKQLLDLGHIHAHRQPICVLAMAGIGHGPFPVLKGSLIVKYFEADAARELFEFMDSTSRIAHAFHQALADVMRQGVKTVLVGSLQDQVVPLYSATLTAISHPNILRAVYIDKHIYIENDFLINLVVFALRLRNLGLSDHGLLTNVSEVLAGSIYALEGGHSTVYEERDVYMMAVRTLFDTPPIGHWSRLLYDAPVCATEETSAAAAPPAQEASVQVYQAKARINPYGLPWVLRGIYDDPRILSRDSLRGELERLRGLYQKWDPTDNRLRELKFRLEPLHEHVIAV